MNPTSPVSSRSTFAHFRVSEGKTAGVDERRHGAEIGTPNGKEIFYRAGNAMMAVDVTETEAGITLGNPVKTLRTAFVDR